MNITPNTREASTSPDAERQEQSLTPTGGGSQDTYNDQGLLWWVSAFRQHPFGMAYQVLSDRSVIGFVVGYFIGISVTLHQVVVALS